MKIQPQRAITLHPLGDGFYPPPKRKQKISVGKNVEKLKPLDTVGGIAKWFPLWKAV